MIRATFLEVETLEGRDLPSALPVFVHPTLLSDWPPPPVVHVGALNSSGAGQLAPIELLCHIGEEIPQ